MAKAAIIVESPTKTRTLGGFLSKDYKLLASMGHVRDLPEDELAVDVDRDFAPHYVVIPGKKKTISHLKRELAGIDEVYLASDPDREGEAIAWHLAHVLGLPNAKRIEFNEITADAVRAALQHPRDIDLRRVNAQQARRILDRLVGYEISPLLWKRISGRNSAGLSAGRVQSAALRLICDREREIAAFVPEEYWSLEVKLRPEGSEEVFAAQVLTRDGEELEPRNEAAVLPLVQELAQQAYVVAKTETRPWTRNPQPPFITSTLQRAAATSLGFSSKKTMQLAQDLYEGIEVGGEPVGLITYMRTDSTRVSDQAVALAREYITRHHGPDYVGPGAKGKRVKGAQDAHEAIRPTDVRRTPPEMRSYLTEDQAALYELIWQRFVGSQMAPARFERTTVEITAGPFGLRASGSKLIFAGYLAVMPEQEEEPEVKVLSSLVAGQPLALVEVVPEQHFTKPPPRYNEASLVQALEENGIGRPSTYAAIIETLRQRKYVQMRSRAFVPTGVGFAVNDYLLQFFPHIMDIQFTARVEADLDEIEDGDVDWVQVLRDYYRDLQQYLTNAAENGPQYLEGENCPQCGGRLVVRYSVRGTFAGCENYPRCEYTRDLIPESGGKTEAEPVGRDCPECGAPLVRRAGYRGRPFIACSAFPKCTYKEKIGADGEVRPMQAAVATDVACDRCGAPMLLRDSRRGKFLGCSAFPKCRNIRSIAHLEQADDGSIVKLEVAPAKESTTQPRPPRTADAGDEPAPAKVNGDLVPGLVCDQCGSPMAVRRSSRGPFVACTAFPQCKNTKPMRVAIEAGYKPPEPKKLDSQCPECGRDLVLRSGRKGKFVGCTGYPKCRYTREAMAAEIR